MSLAERFQKRKLQVIQNADGFGIIEAMAVEFSSAVAAVRLALSGLVEKELVWVDVAANGSLRVTGADLDMDCVEEEWRAIGAVVVEDAFVWLIALGCGDANVWKNHAKAYEFALSAPGGYQIDTVPTGKGRFCQHWRGDESLIECFRVDLVERLADDAAREALVRKSE